MFDELPETVRCDDYRAHQSAHRRVGAGWVCDACAVDSAACEPVLPVPTHPTPHESTELDNWFAAPLREHDGAMSDEWGTLG